MQYLLCQTVHYIPPIDSPPIIIGLTAAISKLFFIHLHSQVIFSVSDFQRSTSGQILRNLILLCAKFDCSTITTVSNKENEEELERSVHRISEDEIICVDKQKSYELLRSKIEKELQDFILQLFISKDTNPSQIFPEKDFRYEWI